MSASTSQQETVKPAEDSSLQYRLKGSEFKKLVNNMVKKSVQLNRLGDKLAKAGKNQTCQAPDGTCVTKEELDIMRKCHHDEMSLLPKYFVESQKKKVKKTKSTNGSFSSPMFVSANMVDFFNTADRLGNAFTKGETADTWGDTGTPLQDYLHLFFKYGLTNRTNLQRLFTIYYRNYQLQSTEGKKFITANDEMFKAFGEIFENLTHLDNNKPGESDAAKDKVFNPESFTLTAFSRIIKYCTLQPDEVSPEARSCFDAIKSDVARKNELKGTEESSTFVESDIYTQFFLEHDILEATFSKNKFDVAHPTSS